MPKTHPYSAERTLVVHTQGSARSIGRQHAEQVGALASKGMVKFYYDFWKHLFENRPSGVLERSAFTALKYLVDPVLLSRLLARVPDFAKEEVRGMSEVTGMPYEQLATSLVLPDLLPLLQSYLTRLRPASFVDVAAPPRFGCTSFLSSGRHFLHGRNLDFPGVSYWDRYQVIQSTAREGGLRYIGFTTAGVPFGGITGVNEAQVSVSLHQHYCKVSSLHGALPFVIAEDILTRCRTAEEALEILQGARVATSWAFVVTDGKSRDGFVYECHPRACGLRRLGRENSILAHSNFFQTGDCRPAEYATTARMNWDNYWRKTRLEELVMAAGRELTLEAAAPIISDHFDPYWNEEKTINRTVSQVYNIQSLVLDPEKMTVIIAEGNCPIQIRSYAEYDLGEIFAGREGRTGRLFPAFRFADPAMTLAKESYILSFVAAFDGNFPLALERVRESLAHRYVPEAGYVAGVLCLKLGDFPAALSLFEQVKASIEEKAHNLGRNKFPPEYFETVLYLARTYDLMGRREEARKIYRILEERTDLEDTNIRNLARAAGPYRVKQLERVIMPYSTYIPFD